MHPASIAKESFLIAQKLISNMKDSTRRSWLIQYHPNIGPHNGRYVITANILLWIIQEPFNKPPPRIILYTVGINQKNSSEWAVLDSGAKSYVLVVDTNSSKVTPTYKPITVIIPDETTFQTTYLRKLNLPELILNARIGHVIPGVVRWMIRLSNEKPDATPLSPTSVMLESAN